MTYEQAAAEAQAAAATAGVEIVPATTVDELDELRITMGAVWGRQVVPPRNVLRGMAIGGAGLLVARRDGQAVGFALGWLGWTGGPHFHSHQVGVLSAARATGAGVALKLAQRAQCLQHDITEMRWTFDPLLAANATFNLVRLGARVVGFLPNCYGARDDVFNSGDITDRVEVSWQLDRPVGGDWVQPNGRDGIAVPADYQRLRAHDPARAALLRRDVGTAFAALFADAGAIDGLCRLDDGVAYVVAAADG